MKLGLTKRQHQLLKFIEWYIPVNGYSPSYEEIADHLDLASKSGVHRLVKGLIKRGHIKQEYALARSIELV